MLYSLPEMRSRPNFVVFIPDQLRFDAVGCFGNPRAHTPNIDALAERGVRFTNAYAQHSVCSPSRVSFLTGWYPHVHGHRSLGHLLKPDDPNLLQLLKQNGYHVMHVGLRGDTFAQGVTKDCTDRFGFAVRPQLLFMPSPYAPEHRLARAFYHGKRPHPGPALDFDEACTRTAEEWLAEGLPEPWILYLPLVFPHPPFEVEEPWFSMHARADMPEPAPARLDDKPRYMRAIRERYGTARLDGTDWAEIIATYYGMTSRIDDQLGRVLQAVERAGAAERTAVLFFTDHGEYLGDYGLVEKWPAGQHDCLLHDPLIIAAPGASTGSVASSFVELVDLVPTILELAEIEPGHTHFGKSLVPLLAEPASPHREAAFSEGGFTLDEEPLLERSGFPYDLKAGLQHDDPVAAGKVVTIRTERWTYVYRLYEANELYDRVEDPRELTNLAARPEHAETEAGLRARLLEWMLATSDVIPWEADPRVDAVGAQRGRRLPE
jgi:arylsulfatase A-like enzyme